MSAIMPLLVSVTLIGCGSNAASENGSAAAGVAATARKAIDGYGDIKFGSSFVSAIGLLGHEPFNPVAVSECFKDLPIKGCHLTRNAEHIFEMRAGIPYSLTLMFNKLDKLTDIGLDYSREGDVKRADCLSLHERTLDWLVADYGQLRTPVSSKEEGPIEGRRTSQGNTYQLGAPGENGGFVTLPMRTVSTPTRAAVETKPIPEWNDQRYVSLLSVFIVVDGKPMCMVNADFNEPRTVLRPVGF